jgi:hypothetical protein
MEGPSFDHPEAIAAAMGVLDRTTLRRLIQAMQSLYLSGAGPG